MSKSPGPKVAAPEESPPVEPGGRFSAVLRMLPWIKRLRGWAGRHWTRRAVVAVCILAVIAATVAAWAFLARVALQSGQVPLQVALDAMDQGRTEQARNLVSRMLTGGALPHSEYGGPLFVLGAIKTYDAEHGASAEKRRVDFLVASRYLKEAQSYGFPPGREKIGSFLLGKSLLESNQFDEGIDILDELLAAETADGPMTWGIHRLLANACLWMSEPNVDKALAHSEKALEDAELSPEARTDVQLDRAHCLARVGRFDDARQALEAIPPEASRRAEVLFARAQFTFDEVETTLQKTVAEEHPRVVANASSKLDEALHWLDETTALAKEDSQIARRAGYLRGWGLKLKQDHEGALREFTRVRQLYGDTPEGLAAALGEADLLRLAGDYPGALLGYRRVLESISSPAAYRSAVLPLSQVRARTLSALTDYTDRKRFDDALVLLTHISPLFSRTEELKFRGEMLERWGKLLLSDAPEDVWDSNETHKEGLRRLREAGVAYEQLAELRYASDSYTNDLWAGAANYYEGHSFSRAILLLNKFLDNAPELRNAHALLRLGQSYLALGKIPQSIGAFEECIEFHPRDSATYQARIDCAKAYWYRGELDKAEKLLVDNIAGSELKPTSREWKDSEFELGTLLYEKGEFEKAIDTLEDAIERTKLENAIERNRRNPQTLLARYVVGESYRGWAEQLRDRGQSAATTTEREKNDQLADQQLEAALAYFIDVQRSITREAQDIHGDPMMAAMLRNCYMLAGAVLFDLQRYKDAIDAYSNVSSHYPNDPFVLETFVQIANCWRRLDQIDKARGAIQQAQIAFDSLPAGADFTASTALGRDEWRLLLADMAKW